VSVPLALTATAVLAQAVALGLRAQKLGPTLAHPLRAEVANIELEASNVRMLLTSALRQSHPADVPLADIEERLVVDGRRLDVIEAEAAARP
jgi:hypothetical protein